MEDQIPLRVSSNISNHITWASQTYKPSRGKFVVLGGIPNVEYMYI